MKSWPARSVGRSHRLAAKDQRLLHGTGHYFCAVAACAHSSGSFTAGLLSVTAL